MTMAAVHTIIDIEPAARMRTPNDSPLKIICLAPTLVWFAALFAVPLIALLWAGFWRVENYQTIITFSLENYEQVAANFFAKSRYGLALVQTFWVAITGGIFAVAFAYAVALAIVYAVPQRWQRLALLFAIAPFWSSYILRVYAWQTVLSKNGVVNSFLKMTGLDWARLDVIFTQTATRIGLVHYLAPILIVILYVTLTNIDRAVIEAARDLGSTRWQVFKKIILPLSGFGLTVAGSFAVIIGMGDALCGALLGGGAGQSIIGKVPLFASMLISDYASATNLPRTAALATILVLAMLLVMWASFAIGERVRKATAE